jgi:hypothetical protein
MSEDLIRLVTQVCIFGALLFAGLGILVFESGDPATQKLAAGWTGATVGYWLQ